MTRKQLLRFVKLRNKSDFPSNFQFLLDAEHAGFQPDDLGTAQRCTVDGFIGYQWNVPTKEGTARMVEFGRRLYVQGEPGSDEMFELMNTATFIADEKAA